MTKSLNISPRVRSQGLPRMPKVKLSLGDGVIQGNRCARQLAVWAGRPTHAYDTQEGQVWYMCPSWISCDTLCVYENSVVRIESARIARSSRVQAFARALSPCAISANSRQQCPGCRTLQLLLSATLQYWCDILLDLHGNRTQACQLTVRARQDVKGNLSSSERFRTANMPSYLNIHVDI